MPAHNKHVNSGNFATQMSNFRDCEEDNSGPPELHMDSDSDEDYDPSSSSSSSSNEEDGEQEDLDLKDSPVKTHYFFYNFFQY